jgi:hypothetical protein
MEDNQYAPPTEHDIDERDFTEYHDKQHHDQREWNSHADQAYPTWGKENHRQYKEFSKINPHDQQAYWNCGMSIPMQC